MFRFLAPLSLLLAACADVTNPDTTAGDNEVITTVVLAFTPAGGGSPTEFRWADPENDGSPVIDPITLSDAEDYTVAVSFLNELEDPPEDITIEVEAESDQHQVFFLGSALGDVVTYTYDDADVNGYPVGLAGTLATVAPGAGTLQVVLRHLPPENDVAVKTGTLADDAAANGIASLPGDSDADVTFDLTVE